MLSVFPIESPIDPGTNIEVLDREPVTKHKKSKMNSVGVHTTSAQHVELGHHWT